MFIDTSRRVARRVSSSPARVRERATTNCVHGLMRYQLKSYRRHARLSARISSREIQLIMD